MNKNSRLKRTAYHEAGHAVACYFLHLPFKYVTIEPEGDTLGHLKPFPSPKSFNPEIDDEIKTLIRIEKNIITYYAGKAVEFILTKKSNKIVGSDDQNAWDLACYYCGGPEETEAFLKWMWERTINWVQNPDFHWDAVEALAQELLKKSRLTSKEARQIIKAASFK